MYEFGAPSGQIEGLKTSQLDAVVLTPAGFAIGKRGFDILVCVLLLPVLCAMAVVLFVINHAANPGPVFFTQHRMGRNCASFKAFKFRTMTPSAQTRRVDEPLEEERITSLGAMLRQSRIDELPQIINVLRGEMSLIGPRPDCYDHAITYLHHIPGYRARHAVLPGISGFAQTEIGYAEGIAATARKVEADLYYIANRSLRFEAWIFWRTLATIVGRAGR
ncbi:sugar transferase [Aliiroseovarius sediminis]|uniref:sugar transferase n=1 Tax=Aliiroseovarius sediminis TaxID=2925839 RepID=UPI001F57EB60|nr:sugar transferase [Aliiroseovarius sediminis]MCI2395673.1 sugar transferase [Aliiroseovarius sediminis]